MALIRTGADKTLVPAYRDMDPYDLPDEFSHLQAQDMGKLGFMQDLIRGIKKISAQEEYKALSVAQQTNSASGINLESLMKRARMLMEDGDFKSANECLDKVLDEDAEYAPAYVGKVCIALGFRKESDLAEATFLYTDHPDWRRALRFATPEQQATYENFYAQTKARVDKQIRDYAYDCAMEMAVNPKVNQKQLNQELEQYMASCKTYENNGVDGNRRKNAKENEAAFRQAVEENDPRDVTEQGYRNAAEMFRLIRENTADKCAENCMILAEQAKQSVICQETERKMRGATPKELDLLADQLLAKTNIVRAKKIAETCRKRSETLRYRLYDEAIHILKFAEKDNYWSLNWRIADAKQNNKELDAYRDIPALREKVAQKKLQSIENEEKRIQNITAKQTKRKRMVIIIFLAGFAVAAYFIISKFLL